MGDFKFDMELFRKLITEFAGVVMLLLLGCILSKATSTDMGGGANLGGLLDEMAAGLAEAAAAAGAGADALPKPGKLEPVAGVANKDAYCLGWGLVYMTVIHTFGFLSGAHLNPAVSACATILGLMDWKLMLLYWLMQLLGSLLGVGLAWVVIPWKKIGSNAFCLTLIFKDEWKGILVEFFLICILLFAYCAVWDKRSNLAFDSVSVRLGLIIAGLIYVSERRTGGGLNFVRTLAPSICFLKFNGIWAHFVGQLLGTVLVSVLWRFLFARETGSKISMVEEPEPRK